MALFEDEVYKVDLSGFLGGGGVVLKEAADAEVEIVETADLVGEFERGVVVVLMGIGTRKEGDSAALKGLEEIDSEIERVGVGEPEKFGTGFGEDDGRTLGPDDTEGLYIGLRYEMKTEETVPGTDVLGDFGTSGFEHLGDPGVTDMAIAADAELVDHPIDGLAGLAAA